MCVSQSITTGEDFGAKGLYNLRNAEGMWTLRRFHIGYSSHPHNLCYFNQHHTFNVGKCSLLINCNFCIIFQYKLSCLLFEMNLADCSKIPTSGRTMGHLAANFPASMCANMLSKAIKNRIECLWNRWCGFFHQPIFFLQTHLNRGRFFFCHILLWLFIKAK